MPNLSTATADALTEHQLELLRVASAKARALLPTLEDLEKELLQKLRRAGLTTASRQRLNALLSSVRGSIVEAYSDAKLEHDLQLGRLVSAEVRITGSILNEVLGATIFDVALPVTALETITKQLLIQGSPAKDWWAKQAGDLQFRFSQQMRLGMAAGETTGQLIDRVIGSKTQTGLVEKSKLQAEALVRTSVLEASNEARLAVYQRNASVLKGVVQVSTLDERTSDICIAYDGQIWNLQGEPIEHTVLPFNGGPPRHWNCRSILTPVTKSWSDLGVKAKGRARRVRSSMDGELPAETTFEEWMGRLSEDRQNNILGKGKADLWRSGKISVTDLVNQRGNPLTLLELQKRYQ